MADLPALDADQTAGVGFPALAEFPKQVNGYAVVVCAHAAGVIAYLE